MDCAVKEFTWKITLILLFRVERWSVWFCIYSTHFRINVFINGKHFRDDCFVSVSFFFPPHTHKTNICSDEMTVDRGHGHEFYFLVF